MSVALSSGFCIALSNWLNPNAPAASTLLTYQHSDMHAKYQQHNWWLYQKALASMPHNFITQYNACQHLKAFCAHFNLQSPTEWTKCLSHPRTAWENDLPLPCNLRLVFCVYVCVFVCLWPVSERLKENRQKEVTVFSTPEVELCCLVQSTTATRHTHKTTHNRWFRLSIELDVWNPSAY